MNDDIRPCTDVVGGKTNTIEKMGAKAREEKTISIYRDVHIRVYLMCVCVYYMLCLRVHTCAVIVSDFCSSKHTHTHVSQTKVIKV